MNGRRLIYRSLIIWAVLPSLGWAQPQFQGIGFLVGSDEHYTSPKGVSADGLVVIGKGRPAGGGLDPFRWTQETGAVSLGGLPLGSGGFAWGVSADGAVVVGEGGSPKSSPNTQAFRWTAETGMVGLGDLPGGWFSSRAFAVSGDGSVVAGLSHTGSIHEAFRWTAETGMVPLGPSCSEADFVAPSAMAISDDGSVIAGGGAFCEGGHGECYRWTEEEGLVSIGVLLFGDYCLPLDVSADASVIVGESDSTDGRQAFRWTQESGMVGLGDLPGGPSDSLGLAVSGDGSIVVGLSCAAGGPIFCSDLDPFIWDPHHGMRNLETVLQDVYGMDLGGWDLISAHGVSADGLVITGGGGNPDGWSEGWILQLPDCNANGQADDLDILDGISGDENGNVIPDECERDCNDNGQDDADDIEKGTSEDCNGNDIPDECEADCNANGQPDACDIEQGVSDDCNADYIPDECDPFPPITGQPEDQQVEPGDFTFFSVTVDGQVLSYQWRHDGVDMQDDERILGSEWPALLILEVVPEDAGAYDCLITYELGCQVISDTAMLTVHGPCPADFDDNGAVGPFDLAILLGNWGPNPDHPADLNDDDIIDAFDLALLLGHWGPCP